MGIARQMSEEASPDLMLHPLWRRAKRSRPDADESETDESEENDESEDEGPSKRARISTKE